MTCKLTACFEKRAGARFSNKRSSAGAGPGPGADSPWWGLGRSPSATPPSKTPALHHGLLRAEAFGGAEAGGVEAWDDGGDEADEDGDAACDDEFEGADLDGQFGDEIDFGVEGEAVDEEAFADADAEEEA